MAKGGPPAAMESFLRWVAGDDAFESLDDELRTRMLGNGEVFFGLELEAVLRYLPTTEQLAQIELPCVVAGGVENRDPSAPRHWFNEASRWFADQFGATFIDTPGGHVPQFTHARALAEAIRPLLRKLSESRSSS
jgi:pimeloyl-ACP methyl ester carboxylesterase